MRVSLLIAAAFAACACATETDTKTDTMAGMTSAAPSAASPPAPRTNMPAPEASARSSGDARALSAASYAMNAAMGDMYEIQSSRLALQKSQSPAVKAFAQMMIDGHTATSAKLKSISQTAGLALPATSEERVQTMLSALQSASPSEFDRRYVEQQISAHEAALALHRGYATSGEHAELRAFATETAPVVEQHLTQVKSLTTT